jgi:ferric-dicitrate binding protein FerR (iron transport regulator)
MSDRPSGKFLKSGHDLLVALLQSLAAVVGLLWPLGFQPPAAPLSPMTFDAPAGKTTLVFLPDKTKMKLAPGTKVSVWFDQKTRRVRVVGQAWFEVVHDPGRPFLVCGSGRLFSDVGTSFDILALSSSVTITVTEGQVGVQGECGDIGDFPPPSQHAWYAVWEKTEPSERPVGARQQITITATAEGFNEARKEHVTDQQLHDIGAWQRGEIVFRNVTLPEALAIINLNFQLHIRIADQSLAKDRLSGTASYEDFPVKSILRALQSWDERILPRPDPAQQGGIELIQKSRDVTHSR